MGLIKHIFFISCLLIALKAFNQTLQVRNIDSLAGQFIKNIRADKSVKLFVQTDKWFYIAGEEIMFRAFCINALSHRISRKDKTIFVDLVNDRDSIISQLLLNNANLRLEGNIMLPARLTEGYYWLRAFTRQMLNQDSNSLYVQPVYIINPKANGLIDGGPQIEKIKDSPVDSSLPELTFYPEGSALVAGTNSVVAFRFLNKMGKPLDISGYIKDSWDSVVTTFKTSMPGIGKFNFFVWKSRKYTAYFKWREKVVAFPLPPVNQFASQLSVTEENDHFVRLRVSFGDSLYKKNKATYLLAVSRDSLCFAAFGTDMYEVIMPKRNIPDGKVSVLLFDEEKRVVSERNIFIDHNNPDIVIRPDKGVYGTREKETLDITIADSNSCPAIALLSLAVTNDSLAKEPAITNTINELENDNIELIENSASIIPTKQYTKEQQDLIMLIQKNRFLSWKYPDDSTFPPSELNKEDSNITSINGKILDRKNQPIKGRIVTLFSNKNTVILRVDTTNEIGRFHFPIPDYTDSSLFTLQVTNLKGIPQADRIVIDTFRFPQFKTPFQLKKRFSAPQIETLAYFKKYELDSVIYGIGKGWLKEVTVKGFKKKPVNYDESKRMSPFSRIITSDQFGNGGINNITNALLMVPGIHLKHGFLIVGAQGDFSIGPQNEPLLVIDGFAINMDPISIARSWDKAMYSSPLMEVIEQYHPSAIDFVEVLAGPEAAIYGTRGANGVIIINTANKLRTSNVGIALMKYFPKGYTNAHSFESPDYSKKETKKSPFPDLRPTIYWNGNLRTDSSGKASVHFFTDDTKTTYTVTAEGITGNGMLIYKKVKINRQ